MSRCVCRNLLVCGAAGAWALAARAEPRVPFTLVARTGDSSITSFGFAGPVINEAGELAADVSLNVPGGTHKGMMTFHARDQRVLAARQGDLAPGVSDGAAYGSNFGPPVLNDSGRVLFRNYLSKSPDEALFLTPDPRSASPIAMHLVAREGSQAPGNPAGIVYALGGNLVFQPYSLGANSHVAFGAGLSYASAVRHGLWGGHVGQLQLLARSGDPVPGGQPSDIFNVAYSTPLASPAVNANGQIGFRAGVTASNNNSNNSLWVATPSPGAASYSLAKVADFRDVAPGGPVAAAVTFQSFSDPSLTSSGSLAFHGVLAGSTFTQPIQGVFLARPKPSGGYDLSSVVRSGEPAPGTPGTFETFSQPLLSDSGALSFGGSVAGVPDTADAGVWTRRGEHAPITLLAREGDPSPAGQGTHYFNFSNPLANARGQVAFTSRLEGVGIPRPAGLFATDLEGRLVTVAVEGDTWQPTPGEGTRTIKILTVVTGSNGSDGRDSAFNDAGQIALRLEFTDGSQALAKAQVPLPGDADANGSVDFGDFQKLLAHFDKSGARTQGDFDHDGRVTFADFQVLERWFGSGAGGTTTNVSAEERAALAAFAAGHSVPEPGLGLWMLAAAGMSMRRSRR